MFISALGAITGKDNRLALKKVRSACVVLVDGLGSENLRKAAGHAPFLNSMLTGTKSINTVFPSTTAAAITSFGTSLSPSGHGILGYQVFDRQSEGVVNMLSGWNADVVPEMWQPNETVAERAKSLGIACFAIGPGEYADSGFTRLNMRGADYLPARSYDERVATAANQLKSKQRSLSYLYFPELDQAAHAFGVGSTQWLTKLEDLDAAIKSMASHLPGDCGMLLTADHGIVDVQPEGQIMLDELEIEGLVSVGGDPRCNFLYFSDPDAANAAQDLLAANLEGRVIVATPEDLKAAGWYDSASIANADKLPDLILISLEGFACYHRGFCKPQSLRMIGQHGGISQSELQVPLLRFGGFA